MRDFRRYLDGLDVLSDLVTKVSAYKSVQGVFVEPHPAWQLAWRLQSSHPALSLNASTVVEALKSLVSVTDGWPFASAGTQASVLPPVTDPAYDFDWYPGALKNLIGRSYPLVVFVHLCRRQMERGRFASEWRDVVGILRHTFDSYFYIVVEERPLARLAVSPGDRIAGAANGTVGGFLEESATGTIRGVTCAHVAATGAQVHDQRGRRLGRVDYDSGMMPCRPGALCNPLSTTLNKLDCSLFPVSSSPSSGCSGPSAQYGSGQVIHMKGATSGGPHQYYVGGIGMIQTVHHAGSDYCFSGLYSIKVQPTLPLPTAFALALAPTPAAGDSGSWILATAAGGIQPDWIGMLTATDLVEGFALDATDVLGWADSVMMGKNVVV